MMDLTVDMQSRCANVILRDPPAPAMTTLSDSVFAFCDGDELTALEILDTTQFGDPFDEAAAIRAVAWAREQLAAHAAS